LTAVKQNGFALKYSNTSLNGFNDQHSSPSALTKDLLEKILIDAAKQLY